MSYAKRKFRVKPSAQFLRDWVAALESGEYRKGTGWLCRAPEKKNGEPGVAKFCCLGVAADLHGDLGDYEIRDVGFVRLGANGSSGFLPDQLYGIDRKVLGHLVDINDDDRYSGWKRVVAYIKETYPYAFEEAA